MAAELDFSETAFLRHTGSSWSLRWFTPSIELDLFGHATLASSHALWESGREDPTARLDFDTRSGRLTASKRADGSIELDFPAEPAVPGGVPADVLEALTPARDRLAGQAATDSISSSSSRATPQSELSRRASRLSEPPAAAREA